MILNFDKSNGLIPAIIQDAKTNKVLMMGYMNQESYDKTVADKVVTFYSRSKKRLWTKGEESGNFLKLKGMTVDCDSDTLLIKVKPVGSVCHTGADTCWGETNKKPSYNYLTKLEAIIEDRKTADESKSYVRKLINKGTHKIAQKVGEEAVELVIESGKTDDDLFLGEAADLLFHYLILLHDREMELSDVVKVLKSRGKK